MKKKLAIIALIFLTGCVSDSTSSFSNTEVNNGDIKKISQPTSTEHIDQENEEFEEIKEPETSQVNDRELVDDKTEVIKQTELPKTFDQKVLFVPQAPFANWDELHKEACEEAAMIIAAKYFQGQNLNEQIMEEEIQKLVQWEQDNGYKIDLTANETSQVLKDYFGLSATVVADVSVEAIKKYLTEGKLIIVPAAGRLLNNPYFRTPGPIYHMLVIRGYDRNEFITNDPGTKRGEGFKYKYQTLINAIHDWDHELAKEGMTEEEMNSGKKVIIVVGI